MDEKLLVLMQGSPRDPEFSKQEIDGKPFKDFFREKGIKLLEDDVIVSCHGNTELAESIAEGIHNLATFEYQKVVVIAQGGLYFALPSIIAANSPTVPVISVPLAGSIEGLDAFLAPNVPSGTACIGGVGINGYETAANIAKEILSDNLFDHGVHLYHPQDKLVKKLEELGIPIAGDANEDLKYGLVLGSIDIYKNGELRNFDKMGSVGILTPESFNIKDCASRLMEHFEKYTPQHTMWARGAENVAVLAAKILSLRDNNLITALERTAENKSNSYEKRAIGIQNFK